MTPAELAILKTELANPKYNGKSHEEIRDLLRAPDRDVPNDALLTAGELFELLDYSEYAALIPVNRTKLFELLSLAPLKPSGANFKAAFAELFASNSQSHAKVSQKFTRKGARFEELKISQPTESDVADALRG